MSIRYPKTCKWGLNIKCQYGRVYGTERFVASALVLAPLLLMGLLIALVMPVAVKLLRRDGAGEITPEWLENFSVSSYYPMERLLNDEDFKFLSRQPGFDLSLYRKFRRERLRIFKQYLNRSIIDFNRLHTSVRAALAYSDLDCSDMLTRLIWIRVRFFGSVVRAECNYRLCLIGFQSLAVHSLIAHLEEMSSQLGLLSVGQAASGQAA